MEFANLINDFAARFAVDGLDAKGGRAALDVDGTEIALHEDAGSGTVVVSAAIGEMPPDARGLFASLALQANFAAVGGAALCLDPDEGELSVTAALPLDLADVESLSGVVESLVNTAEEWRRNAIAFLDVDEEASMNESEEDSGPLFGNSGFLRL